MHQPARAQSGSSRSRRAADVGARSLGLAVIRTANPGRRDASPPSAPLSAHGRQRRRPDRPPAVPGSAMRSPARHGSHHRTRRKRADRERSSRALIVRSTVTPGWECRPLPARGCLARLAATAGQDSAFSLSAPDVPGRQFRAVPTSHPGRGDTIAPSRWHRTGEGWSREAVPAQRGARREIRYPSWAKWWALGSPL